MARPGAAANGSDAARKTGAAPNPAQLNYLRAGLDQPGGKLPLFDPAGAAIPAALIRACIAKGWAERWFHNPMAPDWLVCRLTPRGAKAAREAQPQRRQSTSRSTGALPT
ncbi:MAG: hypothetical protein ABIO39_04960 [Caulobacteraceae bacterium]